jgi:hypothetical protein
MSHKLINVNGHLSLDVYYEIEGMPEQKHWNNKDTWTPTSVHLQLQTDRRFADTLPDSDELTTHGILGEPSPISGITVHGVKNKRKDGQPGKVPVSDHYYSHASLPDWLQAVVHETLTGLAARAR